MKTFFVTSNSGWFVVKAKNQRQARKEGNREFGKSNVAMVRTATQDEIEYYKSQRHEIPEAED